MNDKNLIYNLQSQQLEKAKGELRALTMLHYDSLNKEHYIFVKNMIEEIIEKLQEKLG